MRRFLLVVVFALFAIVGAEAQHRWQSQDRVDAPMSERLQNKDYRVEAYIGGEWQPLKVNGALTSDFNPAANHNDFVGTVRSVMGFAMFTDDFSKPVKVRVTRLGEPFEKVEIRPLSYDIKPRRVDPNTVEFKLRSPKQKVSVEFDGDRLSNIFIIPDLPDERPTQGDVIYFGRGEHEVGELWLKSNQTLYLDEGAVVYGSLRAEGAENIKVAGRGIFCGSRNDHGKHTRGVLVNFEYCKNIDISGLMFRDSPSWTLRFFDCRDVHIDNVKQIGWMINSDGVDLCNTKRAVMENCFFRNYDDNLSLKVFQWSDTRETCDIEVRDNVLWADCAHNLLVGPEAVGAKIHNVRFINNIIIESREKTDPWTGALAIMISDEGVFENILFQDITVEDIRGGKVLSFDFGKYNSRGLAARNITVRNIRYNGTQAPMSVIRGFDEERYIENVQLRNVRFNGKLINKKNFTEYFQTNEFVKGLSFGR